MERNNFNQGNSNVKFNEPIIQIAFPYRIPAYVERITDTTSVNDTEITDHIGMLCMQVEV